MAKRTYYYSNDVLLQYASNQISYLQTDLPAFEAFDPDLGSAKLDAMADLVQWALDEGGDELNVSKLGSTTQVMLEALANSRKVYHQLRYWVLKTFPAHKAVQRQFGIGRFTKVADSQEAMITFMATLTQSVAEYNAQLQAAGAPLPLLDSIGTLAAALKEANDAQEAKKGNRQVDTEERTNKLNELHQHTKDYNTAAEFVFMDEPAKRDLYRPPSNSDVVEDVEEPEPVEL